MPTLPIERADAWYDGVPFLRTPYNYDRMAASNESSIACPEETRTKQAYKEECDINTIVRRFNLTGQLPENVRQPQYADFTEAYDYHTAMNAIRAAGESFMAMPAAVRKRFDNDPGKFVDWVNDDKNHDEARKMGLTKTPFPQEPKEAKDPPAVKQDPPGDKVTPT